MTANRITAIGRATFIVFLGGGIAFAQSLGQPAAVVPASAPSTTQHAGHRAKVVYSNGQLEITANNSSLNQILRDIALQTQMKITGSVTDQPVYGTYGPAAPAKILASLLDGTDSNMVLTAATSDTPAELLLTPRQGGPTPPDPSPAITSTQPAPQTTLSSTPTNAAVTQQAPATAPGTTPDTNTQSIGTSDPSSPPPPRTPQQIYEHLQQLRAQQQSQAQQHPQ